MRLNLKIWEKKGKKHGSSIYHCQAYLCLQGIYHTPNKPIRARVSEWVHKQVYLKDGDNIPAKLFTWLCALVKIILVCPPGAWVCLLRAYCESSSERERTASMFIKWLPGLTVGICCPELACTHHGKRYRWTQTSPWGQTGGGGGGGWRHN